MTFAGYKRTQKNDINALLVCPKCRRKIELKNAGNESQSAIYMAAECKYCDISYPGVDGSFNFAVNGQARDEERLYYQSKYAPHLTPIKKESFNLEAWHKRWHDPTWPECRIILDLIDAPTDKVVLCLGNGASEKELYLLSLGANLIHSDLSLNGPLKVKEKYDLEKFKGRISFQAIDAYAIPLPDNSIDVIYGFEFVHHLPDVPDFLREASRVLKKNGVCIFFDHAFSPVWQAAKMTILRPFMKLSHFIHGISPEDLRATYAGGYSEDYIKDLRHAIGFSRVFFYRTTFFKYLFSEGLLKVLGKKCPKWCYKSVSYAGRLADKCLTERMPLLENSRIEMVWGFYK